MRRVPKCAIRRGDFLRKGTHWWYAGLVWDGGRVILGTPVAAPEVRSPGLGPPSVQVGPWEEVVHQGPERLPLAKGAKVVDTSDPLTLREDT